MARTFPFSSTSAVERQHLAAREIPPAERGRGVAHLGRTALGQPDGDDGRRAEQRTLGDHGGQCLPCSLARLFPPCGGVRRCLGTAAGPRYTACTTKRRR